MKGMKGITKQETVEDIIDEMTFIIDDKKIIIGMKGTLGERPIVYERVYDSTRKVIENNEYETKRPYKVFHKLSRTYLDALRRK